MQLDAYNEAVELLISAVRRVFCDVCRPKADILDFDILKVM